MKKTNLLVFITILLLCVMTSCAANTPVSSGISNTGTTQSGTNEISAVDSLYATDVITEQSSADVVVLTENTPVETQDESNHDETEKAVGGGDYPCKIHDTNYHMLPSELTAFVGGMEVIEEKFNKDTVGEMSCPMLSIKQVIDEFDISVDEFAETIRLVASPIYDIDILFNGTLAEADEFYTDIDWVLSRSSLSTCYMNLYSEIEDGYPDGVKEIDGGIRLLSIPEVVKLLDIKREDLEEMIKKSSDDGAKQTYNYNLDMLYSPDGEIIFEKPDDVSSYELDEMFCRVGRHAE